MISGKFKEIGVPSRAVPRVMLTFEDDNVMVCEVEHFSMSIK